MSPLSVPPRPGLRKALCCLATGPHAELLEIARPSFEAYAERHGYELALATEAPPEAAGRPAAWAKIPFLRGLLRSYDLLLWIDADAVIVDGAIDIASELDDDRYLALVAHHFGRLANPNTGVMLLRSGALADELLSRAWEDDSTPDHPWWEQAALLRVLGYEVDPFPTCKLVRPGELLSGVQFLPTAWNSIEPDTAPHARIKHYAGVPADRRRSGMLADAAAVADAGSASAPAASVVMVPLDARAAWQDFLRLAELPEDPAHEVVVVHLGIPGLDDLLARLGGSVRVVRPPLGASLGASAVAGLSAAEGDVVVLVHGASEIDPGFVARRVEALADPGVTAVFGAYPTRGEDIRSVAARRDDLVALDRLLAGRRLEHQVEVACGRWLGEGRVVLVEDPERGFELRPAATSGPAGPALVSRGELPRLLSELGLFGTGVEIGVQNGLFSEHLLREWPGRTLVSIDPWRAFGADYLDIANVEQAEHDRRYEATRARLARFGDRSRIERTTSVEGSALFEPHSLDFVYIDARHDHDAVVEDLEAWFDRVRPGGVIAGHDYADGVFAAGDFGVRSAVDGFFGPLGLDVHATAFDGPYRSWYVAVPADWTADRLAA